MGTPASNPTHPLYPVTTRLLRSIKLSVNGHEGFIVGTNEPYAPYVHNGTYNNPNKKGYGQWTEPQAEAWNAIRLWEYGDPPGNDDKKDGNAGVGARAFLVYGLLQGKETYKRIYGTPIIGGPPYG